MEERERGRLMPSQLPTYLYVQHSLVKQQAHARVENGVDGG